MGKDAGSTTPISDFLSFYASQNTRNVLRPGIHAFLRFMYGIQQQDRIPRPEELVRYEAAASRYFSEEEDHYHNLLRFATYMYDRPPLTAAAYINAVKEFMAEHRIEFSPRDIRRIRMKLPKGGSRTIEKVIDHDTLRTVLHHMDIRGKAFILTLASSGMRIEEVLKITNDDVDLEAVPAEITLRGEKTKTGEQRYTFLSKEAVEAIKEWKKVREKYLIASKDRNAGLVRKGIGTAKSMEDPRLFPFTNDTAYLMWKNALKAAGLFSVDSSTNRNQRNIHGLRKFFFSQLSRDCPEQIVQMLMGHEGYLTDAYRRFTKEQAAELYLKGEHCITITIPKEVREIESAFTGKLQTHSEIIEGLVAKNLKQEKEIAELKEMKNLLYELATEKDRE